MRNSTIGATFTQRSQPGTVWCLHCARVRLHVAAVGTVDDDPCCANCWARQAAATGCPMVPFAAAATPAPIAEPVVAAEVQKRTAPIESPAPVPEEIVPPVVTETPATPSKEKPMPAANKLTSADKAAIRAADPSITNQELADKYGVSNGAIWYQRNKAAAPKAAKKSTSAAKQPAKVAPQLPPHPVTAATPLDAILARMTEAQVDAAWSILPLADKTEAMRRLLVARLGA